MQQLKFSVQEDFSNPVTLTFQETSAFSAEETNPVPRVEFGGSLSLLACLIHLKSSI